MHGINCQKFIALSLVAFVCLSVIPLPSLAKESQSRSSTPSTEKKTLCCPQMPVKLVLQITIDQLRGDLPLRFKDRFLKNGFNFLTKNGVYYANAHYNHADTETAPGHATLATGGGPAQHGIVASEWWDRKKKKVIYAVEDENYPLLGDNLDSTIGTGSTTKGRAPTNLLSTTIGDELYIASERKSKIYAISGKDRGAILPAGRIGKAFWLSKGMMVTSSYYYKKTPDWVRTWNKKKLADSYKDKKWELLNDPATYWRIDQDKRNYEGGFKHLKRSMPKSFGNKKSKNFYKGLLHSYVNDELVLDFAKHLIDSEKLGTDRSTDYLSLSFSSIDYVGHTWGVESLESEDTLLRVDRNLENLFKFIDKRVGLKNTLIVLSADHGVAEIAEHMQKIGFPSKIIDSHKLIQHINARIKKRFKVEKDLVHKFLYPYIYLNEKLIEELDLELEDVENVAAKAAMKFPGIFYAATANDIREGELPDTEAMYAKIIANYNPKRSGNIHLVADQYNMLVHWSWNGKPGMHGSVWSYDSYVPIVFVTPKTKGQKVVRRVGPRDIAPTIAAYLGIKPPSGAIGNPLKEVIPKK